jgi:hypothetical protein
LSNLLIYSGVSVCEVHALNIPHRISLWTIHPLWVDFKQANKKEDRGESLPGKPSGTGLAKPVAPGWAVLHFHCAGTCPESPKIFLESPDFPETPEYSNFADKIVLSGDFSRLAYSTPSRRHQDPFSVGQAFWLLSTARMLDAVEASKLCCLFWRVSVA